MTENYFDTVYQNFNCGQKIALLMIALGERWATEILRLLKDDDVRSISYWISQLKHVPKELTERVIKDFYTRLSSNTSLSVSGGREYLYNVLIGIMGEAKAKEVVEELSTQEDPEVFRILKKVDSAQLAAYIKNENPQTIALMMGYLEPGRAATIIELLPQSIQNKVMICLAKIEETDPEIVEAMEQALSEGIGRLASDNIMRKIGGIEVVAEILNHMQAGKDKEILEKLSDMDFDLAVEIKELMFVFADIVLLDDKSMVTLLKEVEEPDLILALKGANNEISEKIYKNLSQRQIDTIKDELTFMGPVKASAVKAAQQQIVTMIRKLDEEGKVLIQGKGGDGGIIS
jgi:flagellar motor switch protein FliG